MRLALWELSNVMLNLGFTRALDGTAKNSVCIDIAMYLSFFSLFFSWKVEVCSSSSGENAQFHFFNKCGLGPDKHVYQQLMLFIVESKI